MLKNLSNEPILFVDDDEMWLNNTLRGLRILGLKGVEGCSNPVEVLDILKNKDYSLVVIDLWMPQKPGEILLKEIKEHYPNIPVLVITADNQTETAVKCMRSGAINYLTKPIEPNQVIANIRQTIEAARLERENSALSSMLVKDEIDSPVNYHSTLSQTLSMQKNFEYIDTLTHSILPITITGEVGVGKTQLARSIHSAHDKKGEFVNLDGRKLEDDSIEVEEGRLDELRGLLLSFKPNTVYVRNCDSLSVESQVEFLSVYEAFQDLYNSSVVGVSEVPRIILSSDIDVFDNDILLPDLKFLLQIQHIKIKPLRERKVDIPLLAKYFIDQYVTMHKINTPHVPKGLLPLLEQYQFPNNISELKGMFDNALGSCNRGKLSLESFKEHMEKSRRIEAGRSSENAFESCAVLPTLKEAQYMLILEALRRAEGNQAHAAHLLGISRQGLNRKIQSYGIKN